MENVYHRDPDLEVAVPDPVDPTIWTSKTLREVQPYYRVDTFEGQ